MPRKATVLKKQRQEDRRRKRNRSEKARIKTIIKRTRADVLNQQGNPEEMMKKAGKAIDKTAAKGIIHKNTAARKKSRLAKFIRKYGTNTVASETPDKKTGTVE